MVAKNQDSWTVCEIDLTVCEIYLGAKVFDGFGREIYCESKEEANYLCNRLNQEGDRFVGSKADTFSFDAFVDKVIKDYYEKPIHVERGLHPNSGRMKLNSKKRS